MNKQYPQREFRLSIKKTQVQLDTVLEIDALYLSNIISGWALSKGKSGGWNGKCPFCSGIKSKHRVKEKTYMPAYVYPGRDPMTGYKEGYIFHCCACDTSLTTYKLLKGLQGDAIADKYAQERWNAGQLCGQGWNCPLPSKDYRREQYRRAEQDRKARNYEKKYGSSSTESA